MELDDLTRDGAVRQWCVERLGAPPVEVFFAAESMSSVAGVLLADGRRVALKLRRASDRVLACAQAQLLAWQAGIDCPELLAGPERVAEGEWLSAEQWRPEGEPVPSGDAAVRYVELLAALVEALDGLDPTAFAPPPPWAHYDHRTPGRVWPPAASDRWDPESPLVPATLRALARRAGERVIAEALPQVVGHSDLNGLNVRWARKPIVHDWDSVAGRPEAVLAGILAVNHVELPGAGAITSIDQTQRTLEAYAQRRTLTSAEIEVAWAAGVWVAAYNASFEYLHGSPGAVSVRLLEDGAERLRLAGC